MVREPEVLTVLFTDLVGSTSLLYELGDDAADDLRRAHFGLLRAAIAEHRGREVKSLGDGLMVAFSSVRDAVACAAAMQRAVAEENDHLGLRVGIDAGEPIHEDRDLFGTPVVVARRLCDAAQGGQVLVSDVVRLLGGRRLDLPLEAIGPLDLKGLDDPVIAHAVRWQALPPRVRLCGELAVEHAGTRLDERLPSRQARLLFALLVLERGRGLTRAAIADAIWADEAPPSRDNSIRALLSGVRRVFGPNSVQGRDALRVVLPEGATVDVEEAEASLAEAEAALGRGDARAARRAARRAVDLTAEELLAGLSAAWIDERRAGLEELSLRGLEIEARAALDAGRAPEAERAGRRLVERAPYRESAHALLMEALAAAGNVGEATLAYDRLRTLLRDELGTAPGPAVVALHDRLLAGEVSEPTPRTGAEPRAEPVPRLPLTLARATERPFVSRGPELDRLRRSWTAASGGEGRLAVVAGEPGIGKTSLVARLATEVHEEGAPVLLGRCHAEALVPYEPFVEALRQLPDDVLREEAAVLGRVMPEWEQAGAVASGEDPAARYVLFEAAARALTAAAGRAPLLLVVDDLHWADEPTLLMLRHVARAVERAPLLLLGTYRTTEVPGTEHVVRSLTDLEREIPFDRVALTGLGDAEVAELIGALLGGRSSLPLGAAMRRDTAGNPLFVGQLLRHLDEKGLLVGRDGELRLSAPEGRLGVPDGVKELVGTRLSAFGSETVAMLGTAAVIGRSFDPELVATVQEQPATAVLDAVEEGVAAGLVEDMDADSHAFVHALVREAIYERIGGARRRVLHRRVAEVLEGRGQVDPAELAHHFGEARDRSKQLEYSVGSAQRALAQLAYEDAARHYETALEALGDTDPQRRCELLLALGNAQSREGDTPASKRTYREAAELAEALGLSEPLARAALGYGGRLIWDVSRDDPHLVPLLERALAGIDEANNPLRVRLLARLGGGPLRDSHDPRQRRAMTAEALEAARSLGDPSTLAYALDGYISAHHSPDHTADQEKLATELIEVALSVGDHERAIEAYEHRAAARSELGDLAGAAADTEAMAPLAADLRQPAQEWFVAERRALLALHEGRLPEAEALMDDALRIGREAMGWNALVCHLVQSIVLRRLQGRIDEVAPAARAAAEEYAPSYPLCRCAHLHVLAALGHADEARAGLAALAPDGFAALDFDETWLAAVAFLAEAAHDLGDAAHAEALYGCLEPYADRVAMSTPEVSLGAVARYLGLLAAACGRRDSADAHLEDAVAYNTRIGARPFAALALRDRAALLGDPGLAAQAAEACAAVGMEPALSSSQRT